MKKRYGFVALLCALLFVGCATTHTELAFDTSWQFAEYAKITNGQPRLYFARKNSKHITVCINAGHGTAQGTSVKTQCHPDGSPKVLSGSTLAGATEAVAVTAGMTFSDGTPEAAINLKAARIVRDRLLAAGYDVLMIRDGADVQLDNIARTLFANAYAHCHIAIHYDASDSDKGVFFLTVPDDVSYRTMYPVSAYWQKHHALGYAIVHAIESQGFALYNGGVMPMDLTQTSYSTVPSIDLEIGDKASDYSDAVQLRIAEGIVQGLDAFFGTE